MSAASEVVITAHQAAGWSLGTTVTQIILKGTQTQGSCTRESLNVAQYAQHKFRAF